MTVDNDEEWHRLVEQVRGASSPTESPVLPLLYTLAMETGRKVLRAKFPRLSEADHEDVLSEKFTRALPAIVGASRPRNFFIKVIVRATLDAQRRLQTRDRYIAKETHKLVESQPGRSDDTQAETLAMRACLQSFSQRDQQILRAVYEGEDRERVAQLYRTSRANVDQIVSRAKERWRRWP
jgi:RNA polymerase sigma factor (sigma-70 family)